MEEVFQMIDLVRLKQYEIDSIVNLFKKYFDTNDHLWIFGSRTNLTARGGDIDLYIETEISQADLVLSQKSKFVLALYEEIGEQKIDVVINMLASKVRLPMHEIARQTGVLLV